MSSRPQTTPQISRTRLALITATRRYRVHTGRNYTLPTVHFSELPVDQRLCSLCGQPFISNSPGETNQNGELPVVLPCGHVIGAACADNAFRMDSTTDEQKECAACGATFELSPGRQQAADGGFADTIQNVSPFGFTYGNDPLRNERARDQRSPTHVSSRTITYHGTPSSRTRTEAHRRSGHCDSKSGHHGHRTPACSSRTGGRTVTSNEDEDEVEYNSTADLARSRRNGRSETLIARPRRRERSTSPSPQSNYPFFSTPPGPRPNACRVEAPPSTLRLRSPSPSPAVDLQTRQGRGRGRSRGSRGSRAAPAPLSVLRRSPSPTTTSAFSNRRGGFNGRRVPEPPQGSPPARIPAWARQPTSTSDALLHEPYTPPAHLIAASNSRHENHVSPSQVRAVNNPRSPLTPTGGDELFLSDDCTANTRGTRSSPTPRPHQEGNHTRGISTNHRHSRNGASPFGDVVVEEYDARDIEGAMNLLRLRYGPSGAPPRR